MILRKDSQGLNESEYLTNLPQNNDHIAQVILNGNGHLLSKPLTEIHPYLNDFPLGNYDKYIIGTFPPISYILDHDFLLENNIPFLQIQGKNNKVYKPEIPFYHGNLGSMWDFFLIDNEYQQLHNLLANNLREEATLFLIHKLSDLNINYSDIIYSCSRAEYNAQDTGLNNIVPFFDLIIHLLNNPNAKYLNFNTSTIFNNENIGIYLSNYQQNIAGDVMPKKNAFSLFIKTLQKLGFIMELSYQNDEFITLNTLNAKLINNHFRHKAIIKLGITGNNIVIGDTIFNNVNRVYTIISGPSPSQGANTALVGNRIYKNWFTKQSKGIQAPTKKFRKEIYQHFRNNNWEALQSMNITF